MLRKQSDDDLANAIYDLAAAIREYTAAMNGDEPEREPNVYLDGSRVD